MQNRLIWELIKDHSFDLKAVAQKLYDMDATPYDIGMSVMLTDNHKADLIKYLEDLQDESKGKHDEETGI